MFGRQVWRQVCEKKNEKMPGNLERIKKSSNFADGYGALAHLARAFDWQSRGDQFESGMLHQE